MIRKLKVMALTSVAVGSLCMLSAGDAQAAEFNCAVEQCIATLKPDGTAKNSHHVFIAKKGAASGAVTCGEISGTATVSSKKSTEITVMPVSYSNCTLAGSPATVEMGCHFIFTSHFFGLFLGVHIDGAPSCAVIIRSGECTLSIGKQTLSGLTYTNINAKKEITASVSIKGIKGTAGAACAGLVGFTGEFTEGEYTTGNTIVQAFKDESGKEGAQVNIWWE